jgi:hypothetical protein
MLILTRRVRETLMIGDDVAVTILGVKGTRVRVGIDAPRARNAGRAVGFSSHNAPSVTQPLGGSFPPEAVLQPKTLQRKKDGLTHR